MGGELVAVGAFHAVDQAVIAEQAEQAADFSGVAADVGGVRLLAEQEFAGVAIAEAVPGEFAAQQVLCQWSVGADEGLQAAVAVVGDGLGQLIEDLAEGRGGLDTRERFQVAVVSGLRSGGPRDEFDDAYPHFAE